MHAAFEACPAELCILDPAKEKMCILNKQISFFFHFRAFSKHRHIEQSIKKTKTFYIIMKKSSDIEKNLTNTK